ncbi:zinc finger, CCHC-type containing protein [Tanacetum coccineum]
MNENGEYMDTLYFQSVGIIHETTTPYTPQQNSLSERKIRVLKVMVNFMLSYSGLSQGFWGEAMAVVRLPDPKLKTLGERGIKCIFVGYAEHSKAFRFYVIEPNDSVSINSIIESKDAIFDENIFSSVPRPSLRIPNGTEDIGGSVVLEEVRKGKRNRTQKNFEPEFQLYLIEGTRDEVSGQHSYCFNGKDDPKTFDEAMKSYFKQKSRIDYFDTYALVVRIRTVRLRIAMTSIHNLIIHQMHVKTAFLNGELYEEVDLTKEFFSLRFSMKDIGEADIILGMRIKHESNGITISQSHYIEKVLKKFNYFDCNPVSTHMDTSKKLMPNNGQAVSQLEYSRVIGCLINPDTQHWQVIQRVLKYLKKTMDYKLTYTGYPSVLEGYTDESWINNSKDNSSTSGWVFLLGGVLLHWQKAYSQMYNRKSRHLDVRHSMIPELITNGVIFIEFVRSQQNLADYLIKGLARDLVIKSAEGMGLKSKNARTPNSLLRKLGIGSYMEMGLEEVPCFGKEREEVEEKKDSYTVSGSVDSSSTRNDKHANTKRTGMSSDDLTGSIAKKIGEEGDDIGKHTNGLSAIATKLHTPMMLDSYTSAMCTDSWGRSSYAKAMVELRNLKNPRQDVRGVQVDLNLGSKVKFKSTKKFISLSLKRIASSSGKKNQDGLTTRAGYEWGNSKLAENDDGKPLIKVDAQVDADSDSEVDELFNETAGFMTSTSYEVNKSGRGVRNKSMYEQWKETYNEDPYDDNDFDDYGLIDAPNEVC